jgi:L-alanine-DL-glutamate epimerase-like enolase superfamily enzyme
MDLHGRASPATARALVAKLAPFNPMFIEEPILGARNSTLN